MDNKLKLIIKLFGDHRFKLNEPLSHHTFLRLGGPAKLFFIAFSAQEIVKIIESCKDLQVPFIFYGTGSKIMFSDPGFDGVVIQNRTKRIEILSIKGKVSKDKGTVGIGVDQALIEVDSGVSMSKFVEFLNSHGLISAEFTQTPGSIGGNLFLNQALQQKAESIKVLQPEANIDIISVNDLSLRSHVVLSVALKIKAKHEIHS